MTKELKIGEPAEATFEIYVTMETVVFLDLHHGDKLTWKTVCDAVNEDLKISKNQYPNARAMVNKVVIKNVEMGRASNRGLDPLSIEIDLKELTTEEMYEMDGENFDDVINGDIEP